MDYLRRTSILLIIITALFGCGGKPSDILSRYIAAVNRCDYASAYRCLSERDTSEVTLTEYSESGSNVTEVLGEYTSFRITEQNVSPTGSTITAKAEVSRPDLLNIYKRIPTLTRPGLNKKQIRHILKNNRHEIDACKITADEEYTLVNENGQWRVSADLGRIKRIKQIRQVALEYENRGMFDEALKTIDKLYEMGGINETMSKAYLRIADKQDYIEHSLKMSKIFTNSGARIVITNDGTYGVKKLAIDIMYEKNGTQYTSHQTSDLAGKPFIGHGEQYAFYIDFNGGTIMDITKLEARIINVEF